MRQKILSVVAFVAALSLVSCFSDDSVDQDYGFADIKVSGIEKAYTKTSYVGDRLEISPVVETAFPEGEIEYEWMLLSDKTGTVSEKGDTLQPTVIGHEKNLNMEVNLAPATYQLRFLVRNTKNNYTNISYASLVTVTEFSSGFYILKETADGKTEIDLLTPSGTMATDLLTKTKGEPMQGKPYSLWINYSQYYINPDNDQIETANSISVISDQKQFLIMRTSDLATMYDRSNLLFDEMEPDEQPYAFFFHPMYGILYLSSNGYRTANHPDCMFASSQSAGKFGMPNPDFTGSKHVAMGPASYGGINFWDESTKSILGANYNFMATPTVFSDFTGEELTQNLTNYECLSAGRSIVSGTETDNVILQDNATGARYIYLMTNTFSGQYLSKRIVVPAGSHFANAVHFATSGQAARYIYAAANNQIFAINYAADEYEEISIPTPGIVQNENITYVANPYLAYSGDANFDYLLVGTQQGNNYKVYVYETVGGVPTGNPVLTAAGEGILNCVRNLNPATSMSSFGFGRGVYPIND